MENGEFSIGCFFSNKAVAFYHVELKLVNAKLQILDGKWNGEPRFFFDLINSEIFFHTNDIFYQLSDNVSNSSLKTDVDELHIESIPSGCISEISFSKNFVIDNLYIDDNSEFDFDDGEIDYDDEDPYNDDEDPYNDDQTTNITIHAEELTIGYLLSLIHI